MNKVNMIRLLRSWGIWVREGRPLKSPLGYPSASPIYRAAHGDRLPPGPITPGAIAIDRELEAVDAVIRALPKKHRQILAGTFVHSLSICSTAQWLQIPKTTCLDRYNKALRLIDKGLEGLVGRKSMIKKGT